MLKKKSLTIVFPIYNEEKRLKNLFKSIKNTKIKNLKLFFIFVNDGSTDTTAKKIKKFIKDEKSKNYKLIENSKNQGKGFSIKKGVLTSNTDWILTADVDLSVELNQVFQWIRKKYINNKTHIYWGSRSHRLSILKTKISRVYLGNIFKFLLKILFDINKFDTQCGFKLYNKKVKNIFSKLYLKGFSHDVEIYLICKKLNYDINFLPVKWTHKKNSKINFFSPFKMFIELLFLKLRYL
jgi:dolichyl-phosphate beta-glucosyltransferase